MPVYETWSRIPQEIYGIPSLYWILIFAAALIFFLLLFFIGYYIIYKIRINKALKEEKSIGRPLISPLGIAVASGIVVWIASTVFIVAMLHLMTDISTQNCEYIMDSYRNIVTLQQTVQNSQIAVSYDTELGDYHADTKTVDMHISIDTYLVPGKDDKLTFRIGDSETELKYDSGTRYYGTVEVSVLREYPTGILTLETKGDRINQLITTSPVIFRDYTEQPESIQYETWQKFYPTAGLSADNVNIEKKDGKNIVSAKINVEIVPAEVDESISFTELKLVFDVNDRTFRQVDLMNDKDVTTGDCYYGYNLYETVEPGEIDYYLMAKDADGNTYTIYNLNSGYILNSDEYEPVIPQNNDIDSSTEGKYNIVRDKNGNVLKRYIY